MLSNKRPRRHPKFETIYYWCLFVVFASATVLSALRWTEDYHLFILGAISLTAASLGRTALQRRWSNWVRPHIAGVGTSYVLMLIAFYVDNGKNLPIWKDLPPIMYRLLPAAIGAPIIIRALLHHPNILLWVWFFRWKETVRKSHSRCLSGGCDSLSSMISLKKQSVFSISGKIEISVRNYLAPSNLWTQDRIIMLLSPSN